MFRNLMFLSLGQKKAWSSRKFLDRAYVWLLSKEIVAENNGALDKVYNGR